MAKLSYAQIVQDNYKSNLKFANPPTKRERKKLSPKELNFQLHFGERSARAAAIYGYAAAKPVTVIGDLLHRSFEMGWERYHLVSQTSHKDPLEVITAIYSGLILGLEKAVKQLVELIDLPAKEGIIGDSVVRNDRLYYVHALVTYVRGNVKQATAFAKKSVAHKKEMVSAKKKYFRGAEYYGTCAEALLAIIARKQSAFEEALNSILTMQSRSAPEAPLGFDDDFGELSTAGLALVALAKAQKIKVNVEHRLLPVALLSYKHPTKLPRFNIVEDNEGYDETEVITFTPVSTTFYSPRAHEFCAHQFSYEELSGDLGGKDTEYFWRLANTSFYTRYNPGSYGRYKKLYGKKLSIDSPPPDNERLAVLFDAIFHGVPFPGLTKETAMHKFTATLLAENTLSTVPSASKRKLANDTRFDADHLERIGAFAKNEHRLLAYLKYGRPLFGKRFEGNSRYSYFSEAEIPALRRELLSLSRSRLGAATKTLDQFVQYLDDTERRGLALWLRSDDPMWT